MSLQTLVQALALLGAVGQNESTPPPAIGAPVAAAPVTGPAPKKTTHHAPGDPFERFNRKNYARQQTFDRHVFRPAALGYKHVVPHPVRVALRHFFSNLGEPIVFLNYMLQLKPGKAIETVARFAINSTIGLAGAIDLAKAPTIGLPHRPNGFANTLGYYGVKPGPYLFLPFVGPTTLRDLFGNGVDGAVEAPTIGDPFDQLYYQLPHAVIPGLDLRAESDSDLQALLAGAVDPYATLRSVYLQDRAGEIRHLHGSRHRAGQATELGDALTDPAAADGNPRDSNPPELADPMTDPAAPPTVPAVPATPSAPPTARPTATQPPTPAAMDDPLKDPAATPPS